MELHLITFYSFAMSIISLTFGQTVTVLDGTQTQVDTTGLFWDYMRGHLLYVDKYYKEVRLRVLDTGEDLYITLDKLPSFVVPTKGFDHRFIIGQKTNAVYLFWPYDITDNYFAECLIATLDYDCQGNTFNDARADAYGRLWTATFPIPYSNGSYPDDQGSLYRIDTRTPGKADITAAIRPVTYGNDLTWTRDNSIFYFIESDSDCVYSYKYDLINGVICCGQTVFCLADYNITGRLNGMTIDWNDDLWIAVNGAGLVLNVNPNTQQLMRTVTIPCKSVTDVEFGGSNLDIMFVSSKDIGDPTDISCGSIFQVTGLDVSGIQENYPVMNSDCTPEFFGTPTDVSN